MKSYLVGSMFNRFLPLFCLLVLLLFGTSTAKAGSIFLTGHDPDFHSLSSFSDPTGPRKINTTAIGYILDPGFNAFAAQGVNKFLFVESSISTPARHRIGKKTELSLAAMLKGLISTMPPPPI